MTRVRVPRRPGGRMRARPSAVGERLAGVVVGSSDWLEDAWPRALLAWSISERQPQWRAPQARRLRLIERWLGGLSQAAVSRMTGLSQARICQISATALLDLRKYLAVEAKIERDFRTDGDLPNGRKGRASWDAGY